MNGFDNWLQTPSGRYALAWEQARLDAVVADLFGYHALQLGLLAVDALAANRMPHRWRAALAMLAETNETETQAASHARRVALVTSPAALPFPQASLDLIALPHTLDHGTDPQAVLREVERVLVHEGHMVITGVNPASLWGLSGALPAGGKPVNPRRLRALLRDTDLELVNMYRGGYGPTPQADWEQIQPGWFDRWGARLWPASGALWCAVAVKRSHGAMLIGPAWKTQPAAAGAQAGVAQRTEPGSSKA